MLARTSKLAEADSTLRFSSTAMDPVEKRTHGAGCSIMRQADLSKSRTFRSYIGDGRKGTLSQCDRRCGLVRRQTCWAYQWGTFGVCAGNRLVVGERCRAGAVLPPTTNAPSQVVACASHRPVLRTPDVHKLRSWCGCRAMASHAAQWSKCTLPMWAQRAQGGTALARRPIGVGGASDHVR
jgi:hypothetical protein